MPPPDDLPFSAAADRNKDPILVVLRKLLPPSAAVLEVASGTGQHTAHFAAAQPDWQWQPSDTHDAALQAIAARCARLANVRVPIRLNVLEAPSLPPACADAVYCANMLHVAPWAACAGLMRVAAHALVAGGRLLLYGPYRVDGVPTAPSNLAFDVDLRGRDPEWGLRRLADVQAAAESAGLGFDRRVEMPANNLMLVFVRRVSSAP